MVPSDHRPPVKILIVDDEQIVLVALRETLARAGYHVKTAPDPIAALEMLQVEQFAVIISDQQMPSMTGLDFLSQAKEMQPNAARLLITAVLSLETVIESINRGEIYRFIIKPWLREELLETIQHAVQRYHVLRNNAELQATLNAINEKLVAENHELQLQVQRLARENETLRASNTAMGK